MNTTVQGRAKISYEGMMSSTIRIKKESKNSFVVGDSMEYVGYTTYKNQVYVSTAITQQQNADEAITLLFDRCQDTHSYGIMTDLRDGNTYKTITIGSQIWMAENLKYLPSVDSVQNGSEDAAGSYYYVYGYNGKDTAAAKAYTLDTAVNNVPAGTNVYQTFGVLYNWHAAMDGASSSAIVPSGVQGVCPTGWHLPSNAEWDTLQTYLIANGYNYDGTTTGNKIGKSMASQQYWKSDSIVGAVGNDICSNNRSGFSAVSGGYRGSIGNFYGLDYTAYFWSTMEYYSYKVYVRYFYYYNNNFTMTTNYYKEYGFSVRCVKD